MTKPIRRWAVLSLFIGATLVACTSTSPGTSDAGTTNPDSSSEPDAISPSDAADATADGADAGGDATDSGDAGSGPDDGGGDASDASDAAAAADADADAEADAEAGVDAGVRWVIVSCSIVAPAPNAMALWIDSDGNAYRQTGLVVPPAAGSILGGGNPAPYWKVPAVDLAALLVAVQTLDVSAAGYTTTTGPIVHQTTRNGLFHSSGAPLHPKTLVDSWVDGVAAGQKTVVSHNDPAAVTVRKYRCFTID